MSDNNEDVLPPWGTEEFDRHMAMGGEPSAMDKGVWAIMNKFANFEPNADENQVAAVVVLKPGLDKDDAEWIFARLHMLFDFVTYTEYKKGSGTPVVTIKKE